MGSQIANYFALDRPPSIQSETRLLVDFANPQNTVEQLGYILRRSGKIFERGEPVCLGYDKQLRRTVVTPITASHLVMIAHQLCRPYKIKFLRNGERSEVDVLFPKTLASMYLENCGEWNLPLIQSVVATPLLQTDGTIRSTPGYDLGTGVWLESVPNVATRIPAKPRRDHAQHALSILRKQFRTFCFADGEFIEDPVTGAMIIDPSAPPGNDESAFLVALLTAICRPSLTLSPGILIGAASISGAGTGKGLLARSLAAIAFGLRPSAITGGSNIEELEKRIAAELLEGGPILFMDNLNNTVLRSDLLASILTEPLARIRILGRSQMAALNTSALILLTGNGLTVSEDLSRRFISVFLDAQSEEPELRHFKTNILEEIEIKRTELLTALLTIWRWGRTSLQIEEAIPLGSFEQWCQWVRDPLVALGCIDPVRRLIASKRVDANRQNLMEVYNIWYKKHGSEPVAANALCDEVKQLLVAPGASRQLLATKVHQLAGTRLNGFILERIKNKNAKWTTTKYVLTCTSSS